MRVSKQCAAPYAGRKTGTVTPGTGEQEGHDDHR